MFLLSNIFRDTVYDSEVLQICVTLNSVIIQPGYVTVLSTHNR